MSFGAPVTPPAPAPLLRSQQPMSNSTSSPVSLLTRRTALASLSPSNNSSHHHVIQSPVSLKRKHANEPSDDGSSSSSSATKRTPSSQVKQQQQHSPLVRPAPLVHHLVDRQAPVLRALSPENRLALLRRLLRHGRVEARMTAADVLMLRGIGAVQGFHSTKLRYHAYRVLLLSSAGTGTGTGTGSGSGSAAPATVRQPDVHQIRLDAARSFVQQEPNNPDVLDTDDTSRATRRAQLATMLQLCLQRHWEPHSGGIHYYQGFGDVCAVLLVQFGPVDAQPLVEAVATGPLHDTMRTDFNKVESKLALILPVIGAHDPALRTFLGEAEVTASFAVSWLLTWFARFFHHERVKTLRAFDFILATDAVYMPVYVAAAVVLLCREHVLRLPREMPAVFQYLTATAAEHVGDDVERLLDLAFHLYQRYPVRIVASLGESLSSRGRLVFS